MKLPAFSPEDFIEPLDYYDGFTAQTEIRPTRVNLFIRSHTEQNRSPEPAIHHRYNLIFVIRGSGVITMKDGSFLLDEGSIFCLLPYQAHYYPILEEKEIFWVYIGFDLPEHGKSRFINKTPYRSSPFLEVLLWKFISLYSHYNGAYSDDPRITSLLSLILEEMIYQSPENPPVRPELKEKDLLPNSTFLITVQQHVHDNLNRKIKLEELAALAGVSLSTLQRKFKKLMGLCIGSYITRERIYESCHFLRYSDMNISEVSRFLGFESIYSYSRTFKSVTGLNPSHFKRSSN